MGKMVNKKDRQVFAKKGHCQATVKNGVMTATGTWDKLLNLFCLHFFLWKTRITMASTSNGCSANSVGQ